MGEDIWMRCPNVVRTNQTVGLEYLTELDRLQVIQKRRQCGDCSSAGSRFTVKNIYNEKVYFAEEEFSCDCQNSWNVTVVDSYGIPSIHMYRPMVCSCQCQPIDVEVHSPPGNLIGSISHELAWFSSKFKLKNAAGDIMLYINVPFARGRIGGDVEFKLLGSDEQSVIGKISKQWTGWFSFATDRYGVSFPLDLDVSMKAVVLAASLLIDYTYYDHRHD
ncbi:hypothetical protein GE061_003129 [Apolygus lucorum]|uniref:Phospholipid scramblase n=1 Tax=Apolygus lucorum TaxID=248454 RepID=A0A6A4JDH8_APOLU|nr:hypothetical protein GE061_003129 [Apolygus lucorum]